VSDVGHTETGGGRSASSCAVGRTDVVRGADYAPILRDPDLAVLGESMEKIKLTCLTVRYTACDPLVLFWISQCSILALSLGSDVSTYHFSPILTYIDPNSTPQTPHWSVSDSTIVLLREPRPKDLAVRYNRLLRWPCPNGSLRILPKKVRLRRIVRS
jgi:hypothetical protein